MHKFNTGDIVTAVEGAPYFVTTSDATMEVLGYNSRGWLNVIILTHDTAPSRIGTTFYDIHPRYMLLVHGHTTVTLDGNFNIISGDLTDDEQKDFYTALQSWKSECEEPSPSSAGEADQTRELELPTAGRTPSHQLGEIATFRYATRYGTPTFEFVHGSRDIELQAGDLQSLIAGGERRDTRVDSVQTGSVRVAGAGTHGRSTYAAQGAQRERDRTALLDRLFGRG